jgi:galactokinase
MDQMAASLAGERAALFLDTRSLEFEQVPLPDKLALVVINSGVAHQHAGGDYVTRRRESEEAAGLLGVKRLRDASLDRLREIDALPPVQARRARHVVTENGRVLDAVSALKRGDLQRLGALFQASHASMRDDYEISIPAVDLLVDLATHEPGVHGARMTGGGFGGAVVIAAAADLAADIARNVSLSYSRQSGNAGDILIPKLK